MNTQEKGKWIPQPYGKGGGIWQAQTEQRDTAQPQAECEMWRKKAVLWKEERRELNNECYRHNKLRLETLAHAERLAEAAAKVLKKPEWTSIEQYRAINELREALAAWEGAQ